MQKRYIMLIGLLGVMIVFVFHGNEMPDVVHQSNIISQFDSNEKFDNTIQAEEAITPVRRKSDRKITSSDLKKLHRFLPDKEEVKAEAGRSPHQTPESLIRFAATLGKQMEKAKMSPQNAKTLMGGLNDCVSDSAVAISARVLCLSKSEELAGLYPKLSSDLMVIKENADDEVIKLHHLRNSFNKH